MSDKNKYASSSLADLVESPLSKYFREQQNRTQAFNVESPAIKALREQSEMLGHITSMKPDFIKAIEKQQEDFARLTNTEPTIVKALREQQERLGRITNIKSDFIKAFEKQQEDFARLTNTEPTIAKALREQQERLGHAINAEPPFLKALREQQERLGRIIDLHPSSSLNVLNEQQDVLSCHSLFRSLEYIKNEHLELKEQAHGITSKIAEFLNSEEKQTLEESLSAHSLTSWLSAVFIVHYTVREMTISSFDIDGSFQPLMQENIDNTQNIVSLTTSNTMFHFLVSLRRNYRLGELLAQ